MKIAQQTAKRKKNKKGFLLPEKDHQVKRLPKR